MTSKWEEDITNATGCMRCDTEFKPGVARILSIYDHKPICMSCKKEEEARPDYEEVAKNVMGQCMADTEMFYGDPQDYCYHHFYPYTGKHPHRPRGPLEKQS